MAPKEYKNKTRAPRARFSTVDVWRGTFGPISVAAVYDVYASKMDIPFKDAKRLDFNLCVDTLRELEDPSYIPWKKR